MPRPAPLATLALAFALGGCGSAPRSASALTGLPAYSPEESALFDDVLAPPIFGLPGNLGPAEDPKLADRARRADSIARVKVSTVTEESLAGVEGYTLQLTVEGGALSGHPEDPVEIRVSRTSPAFSFLSSANEPLVGHRFLAFFRTYADRGEARLHFHGEKDDPAVRKAIAGAKGLDRAGTPGQTAP